MTPTTPSSSAGLRLHHTQVVGSHNSYHLQPPLLLSHELAYAHESLETQLSHGKLRSFEFDLHPNSADNTKFRVHHLNLIDDDSTCSCLVDCLGQLRAWSELHPGHSPLYVVFELKKHWYEDVNAAVQGVTAATLRAVEARVLTVWDRARIITPADVRGGHRSLREAVRNQSWPIVSASVGKAVFLVMDHSEAYIHLGPDDDERVLFLLHRASGRREFEEHVAFVNEPGGNRDMDAVRRLVQQGYMVRTRVDGPASWQAGRLNAALTAGAQLIFTDFERKHDDSCCNQHKLAPPGYATAIPGPTPGSAVAARCNPVSCAGCDPNGTDVSELW